MTRDEAIAILRERRRRDPGRTTSSALCALARNRTDRFFEICRDASATTTSGPARDGRWVIDGFLISDWQWGVAGLAR